MGCLSTCCEWIAYFNPFADSYEPPKKSLCYCCGCCCCNGTPAIQMGSAPQTPAQASERISIVVKSNLISVPVAATQPTSSSSTNGLVRLPDRQNKKYKRMLQNALNFKRSGESSSEPDSHSTNGSSRATPSPNSADQIPSRMRKSKSCSALGPSSRSQYNSINSSDEES